MDCKHDNIQDYQDTSWCRDCGAFKAKNYVKWVLPSYLSKDSKLKLMKNRNTENGKDD